MRHIKNLSAAGFSPDRTTVRSIAYRLAKELGIPNKFNDVNEMAGYDWLNSFLKRNPELSLRQAEGLSVSRAQGMNKEDVDNFFKLLENILRKNKLFDRPFMIFNVDESGLQANNKPGTVIAVKGSKNVHNLTSGEKGETVSIIACCSASGQFLPPTLIYKGVYKKPEFEYGLPPGSTVFMNPKSSYISADLFSKWFNEVFLVLKPPGNSVLILDGHASHCSSPELLQTAVNNEVALVCLPSHTTHVLQPLDRSFFGPLKTYFRKETNAWMANPKNEKRQIERRVMGMLIGKAWGKAATVANAVSGFRVAGIFPFDPNVIPDELFQIAEQSEEPTEDLIREGGLSSQPEPRPGPSSRPEQTAGSCSRPDPRPGPSSRPDQEIAIGTPTKSNTPDYVNHSQAVSTPSTSHPFASKNVTPSKILKKISPVPVMKRKKPVRKQLAMELTSKENITLKQKKLEDKTIKMENKSNSGKRLTAQRKRTVLNRPQDRFTSNDGSSSNSDLDQAEICCECWEAYSTTKKTCDWISCIYCDRWLHENCSPFPNSCIDCKRKEMRRENMKNKT